MTRESTPIHLEFTLTRQEWSEARRAATWGAGRTARRRLRRWVLLVLLGVGLAWLAQLVPTAPDAARPTTNPNPPFFSSYIRPLIPWVLIQAPVWFFVVWQASKRGWKQNPISHTLHVLDADEHGVQFSTNVATSQWKWEAFVGWTETKGLLLLRLEPNTAVPIPRRVADPAGWEVLRQLVRSRVMPRTGGFPLRLPGTAAPSASQRHSGGGDETGEGHG